MSRKSLRADDLEIINKYSGTVYRMAYSMVKNKYDAEDIHQEVFAKYIDKKPKFESVEHEHAWFLRVTINMCKNLWKTAWRQRVVSLEEDLEQKTCQKQADMMEQLSPDYRTVIHLFYYEEMSIEEISKVLKMKPSTVRTQLTRARVKLKGLLENDQ